MKFKHHDRGPRTMPSEWAKTIIELGNITEWEFEGCLRALGNLAHYNTGEWFDTMPGFSYQRNSVDFFHKRLVDLLTRIKEGDLTLCRRGYSWPKPKSDLCDRVLLFSAETAVVEMVLYVDHWPEVNLDQYHFSIRGIPEPVAEPEPNSYERRLANKRKYEMSRKLDMCSKTITLEEYQAEGSRLFGDNPLDWKFVCPACGYVACGHDYLAAGAPEGAVGYSCIGRYLDDCQEAFGKEMVAGKPCNLAGGGLFQINPVTITNDGQKIGKYFDFFRGGDQ